MTNPKDIKYELRTISEANDILEEEDVDVGYIPGEVEGAIPNGSKIRKSAFREGDHSPIGSTGVVISSVKVPDTLSDEDKEQLGEYAYFVEWDHFPGVPVGVAGRVLEEVKETS